MGEGFPFVRSASESASHSTVFGECKHTHTRAHLTTNLSFVLGNLSVIDTHRLDVPAYTLSRCSNVYQ